MKYSEKFGSLLSCVDGLALTGQMTAVTGRQITKGCGSEYGECIGGAIGCLHSYSHCGVGIRGNDPNMARKGEFVRWVSEPPGYVGAMTTFVGLCGVMCEEGVGLESYHRT